MLLPRRSLYILRDEARYEWSHAVPPDLSTWRGGASDDAAATAPRGRRIAMIFRDRPPDERRPGDGSGGAT